MTRLATLPYLTDLQRTRRPAQKGKTRLEVRMAQSAQQLTADRAFQREVWTRDRYTCRCCRRKVHRALARIPMRGEVHHLHGRLGALRTESRCALLLCCACHERVTGRVNDRLTIEATQTFEVDGQTYTDARQPVIFRRSVG